MLLQWSERGASKGLQNFDAILAECGPLAPSRVVLGMLEKAIETPRFDCFGFLRWGSGG